MFRVVRYLPVARPGRAHATALRAGVGQAPREETAGHAAVVRSTLRVYGDWGRSRRTRIPMPALKRPPGRLLLKTSAWMLVLRKAARAGLLRIQRWLTRCCPASGAASGTGAWLRTSMLFIESAPQAVHGSRDCV